MLTMTKTQYVKSMDNMFSKLFYGKGSMYWSPSGGSTSSSTATRVAVPTASSEMHIMRTNYRELCVDRDLFNSNTLAVNLLCSYNLSTSMEVQRALLQDAGATHLGVGPNLSDDKVCDIIEQYGANMLIGGGSHIIQFTIYCLRNNRRLPTIKRISHGGENFGDAVAKCFSKVWHEDVGVYGMYGSSEAGIFALKRPEQLCYEIMPDSVHLEIVDEHGNEVPTGQVGTIVVTNLVREILPQVRYYTGDLARFVSEERNKIDLLGRDLKSVQHQIGSRTVSWDEIEEYVRPTLGQFFGGLCLYQIWIHNIPNDKLRITLPVYANFVSEAMEEAFSKELVQKLWKLFRTDKVVSDIGVKMVRRSEEMSCHMFSNKLNSFVIKQ